MIRINLLAEDQDIRSKKLRDPQFLGFAGAGILCLLVTFYSLSVFMKRQSLARDVTNMKQTWTTNEKKYKELKGMQTESLDLEYKVGSLHRYVTNRFLWGPIMDDLQNTHLKNIYLSSLEGKQTLVYKAERTHGESKIPPETIQQAQLILKGFDASSSRTTSVNAYSAMLTQAPQISSLIDVPEQLKLHEIGIRRPHPMDKKQSFVGFTLMCVFNEKLHK